MSAFNMTAFNVRARGYVSVMGHRSDVRRSELGFAEVVENIIGPILVPHGYAVAESTPTLVRFESPTESIRFMHDRLSYEIESDFALEPSSLRVTLRDVVETTSPDTNTFLQASTRDAIQSSVKKLALLLHTYADSVIRGDLGAFQRIRDVAAQRDEKYTIAVTQNPIRREADEAWHRRDYGRVRRLYESIEDGLGAAERSRLEYARKHE